LQARILGQYPRYIYRKHECRTETIFIEGQTGSAFTYKGVNVHRTKAPQQDKDGRYEVPPWKAYPDPFIITAYYKVGTLSAEPAGQARNLQESF